MRPDDDIHAHHHDHGAHGHGAHGHGAHGHGAHDHGAHDHGAHDHGAHDHADEPPGGPASRVPRIGIGGPVGSGKTALVAALCRALSREYVIGVVTNDIYTTEDADFLRRAGVLPDERIRAVQTGACPHTAIRDDISANLDAVEQLEADCPDLDLVLVESGGDNLTATFSYGLIHRQIFVIDVAGGDKVPRKGGPGVTRSDLLVINKTDLAPLVGADLAVMDRDAAAVRDGRPVLFTSLAGNGGAAPVADWVQAVVAELAGDPTQPEGRRLARNNPERFGLPVAQNPPG